MRIYIWFQFYNDFLERTVDETQILAEFFVHLTLFLELFLCDSLVFELKRYNNSLGVIQHDHKFKCTFLDFLF